jgi:drug/metabolite transporter (DMT)-like permease
MLAATLGFGIIPIFLKHFAHSLDAWTVNGVRYSVGALFWLPFLLVLERQPGRTRKSKRCQEPFPDTDLAISQDDRPEKVPDTFSRLGPGRSVWRDALVPSIVNTVGQAAFGVSPYFVPASTMGFVLRLSFLFTIVFGFAVIAEERLLARKGAFWLGAVLSLAGVLAMFVEEIQGGIGSMAGLAIIVVTAVAWGAYSVTVRYYMADYSARESFGVISLYTSAALVVLMFLFGRVGSLAGIGLGLWANLMLSALIGIAFGHVLYYRGIHRLGPVVASGMSLMTPFVTYLAAVFFLGERLNGLEWLGGALVVVGGGLLVLARAQIESAAQVTSADVDDYPGD